MVVLCTNHGGGLGKTTLAVHIAGVLSETQARVLLIDCDSQQDSFHFFTGERINNESPLLRRRDASLSVVMNRDRLSLKRIARVDDYDHVVIDIDTPLPNTVQTIVDTRPDRVFVPISAPFEQKGLSHLPRVLATFSELARTTGHGPEVVVVPLGVGARKIQKVVAAIADRPAVCYVFEQAPRLALAQVDTCLYSKRQFVWDEPDVKAQSLKPWFRRLLSLE